MAAYEAFSVLLRAADGSSLENQRRYLLVTMPSCAQWPVTEAEWATFAANAEGVVSREHTLWRPSHM
ncbi:hypothetical protein [Streptomyces sp. NPDC050355]|uniref:hypothetical protein n=1 Tax=Streptomyces sp. NPDC050355 TaxID=3365609 RepID=UPI0037ADEBA0